MSRKVGAQGGTAGRKRGDRKAAGHASGASSTGASEEESGAAEAIDPADPDGIQPADLSALEDGKLYYRIGEVSQITGVKPYVLRYWESEFHLMAPHKSRSKQRLYRQKDIETVLAIKRLLYQERYTIAGARRRLRELGSAARTELATAGAPPAVDTAAGLREIRAELLAIRSLLATEA
jgi:DNA-binding transcriptional MerR regulator